MRTPILAALAIALISTGCAQPSEDAADANTPSRDAQTQTKTPNRPPAWPSATAGDASFSVLMPAQPKPHSQTVPVPGGTITFYLQELVTANTNYTAGYSTYPPGFLARMAPDDDARLRLASAASAKKTKATNVTSEPGTLDGYPCRKASMHITIPETGRTETLRKVSAIANGRMYMAQSIVLDGAPATEHDKAKRFLDSFTLKTP